MKTGYFDVDGKHRKPTPSELRRELGYPAEMPRSEETYVETWVYWRIARDGTPTVSICDDPMGHPHAHLVRVPIPEDVQKCIDATKNPPLCLVVGKHGEPTGECPKPSNEPETP